MLAVSRVVEIGKLGFISDMEFQKSLMYISISLNKREL